MISIYQTEHIEQVLLDYVSPVVHRTESLDNGCPQCQCALPRAGRHGEVQSSFPTRTVVFQVRF